MGEITRPPSLLIAWHFRLITFHRLNTALPVCQHLLCHCFDLDCLCHTFFFFLFFQSWMALAISLPALQPFTCLAWPRLLLLTRLPSGLPLGLVVLLSLGPPLALPVTTSAAFVVWPRFNSASRLLCLARLVTATSLSAQLGSKPLTLLFCCSGGGYSGSPHCLPASKRLASADWPPAPVSYPPRELLQPLPRVQLLMEGPAASSNYVACLWLSTDSCLTLLLPAPPPLFLCHFYSA